MTHLDDKETHLEKMRSLLINMRFLIDFDAFPCLFIGVSFFTYKLDKYLLCI